MNRTIFLRIPRVDALARAFLLPFSLPLLNLLHARDDEAIAVDHASSASRIGALSGSVKGSAWASVSFVPMDVPDVQKVMSTFSNGRVSLGGWIE